MEADSKESRPEKEPGSAASPQITPNCLSFSLYSVPFFINIYCLLMFYTISGADSRFGISARRPLLNFLRRAPRNVSLARLFRLMRLFRRVEYFKLSKKRTVIV